jgi:hypothetical protein
MSPIADLSLEQIDSLFGLDRIDDGEEAELRHDVTLVSRPWSAGT